ncbi:hypothetical protein Avbf_08960 [Armadillidium vulgare]|nr:hypothetical protein Avbf_08960 [Armadillidium vulgare]
MIQDGIRNRHVLTPLFRTTNMSKIANEDKLEMSITNILSNPSLYREAQHLQKQVDVVSKALDKLQSDTATLSIAVNEWLVLLESEVLDPYKANIRKRMEEATEPFFFVANMMDPNIVPKELNSSFARDLPLPSSR